jgi:serine protease
MSAVSRTGRLAVRSAYADFDVMTIDPGEDAEAVAAALRQRSDVEYAQAAYRVRPAFVPNDFFFPRQWNLGSAGLDMPLAWDVQPAAASAITVAVLDTGVAYTNARFQFHADAFVNDQNVSYPALGDLTLAFAAAPELQPLARFVKPHDFIWNDDFPVDLDGHGTHVSGTIGQLTNNAGTGLGDTSGSRPGGTAGVAFNAKLMPVKVLSSDWDDIFGSPNAGTDDIVALGIRYAADNGAKVINMSLGREGPSAPVVEDAIKYAVGKGCFIAVAGGNGFADGNPTEVIAEIANRVQGAVSVAAVTPDRTQAFYSTTGSYIELSAPGGDFGPSNIDGTRGILQQTLDLDLVDTFTLAPSQYGPPRFDAFAYFFFIGTSQSTPHVSGVAAMLMQQGITDPAAVEAMLEQSAIDLGTPGRDPTFGFGLINPPRTLRGLGLAR